MRIWFEICELFFLNVVEILKASRTLCYDSKIWFFLELSISLFFKFKLYALFDMVFNSGSIWATTFKLWFANSYREGWNIWYSGVVCFFTSKLTLSEFSICSALSYGDANSVWYSLHLWEFWNHSIIKLVVTGFCFFLGYIICQNTFFF